MVVGMSGFILGPVLGGTALAAFPWERSLGVNAPIALIAWIGVRLGVSADRHDDLTYDALDFLGAALSMAAIGFAFYTLTSGVDARSAGRVDRHGGGDVRADPALSVRLRLEPGGRRTGQPADDPHHAGGPTDLGTAGPPPRAPHRLRGRRGAAGRVAGPICAVALVDATPANRTSIGTALNDTAQEIGDEEDTEPAPQPAG